MMKPELDYTQALLVEEKQSFVRLWRVSKDWNDKSRSVEGERPKSIQDSNFYHFAAKDRASKTCEGVIWLLAILLDRDPH